MTENKPTPPSLVHLYPPALDPGVKRMPGDFRPLPIRKDTPDPKGLSAQESASSSANGASLLSEKSHQESQGQTATAEKENSPKLPAVPSMPIS